MGEMKVEHVLLFLVGVFLVYHMMVNVEGLGGLGGLGHLFDAGIEVGWDEFKHATGQRVLSPRVI